MLGQIANNDLHPAMFRQGSRYRFVWHEDTPPFSSPANFFLLISLNSIGRFYFEQLTNMTSNNQISLLKDLDSLVSTRLGVAPVAPALHTLLMKIMGAEAVGMCWFSKTGEPEGLISKDHRVKLKSFS